MTTAATKPAGTWIPCSQQLPPEGVEVLTMIHDASGCRNEQTLRREGRLWFAGGLYVYYVPTHWLKVE